MADLTINPKTIIVKTAAEWGADTTVYNERQELVTSDEFWPGTDQRKSKRADGVKKWSQLDYPPIGSGSVAWGVITGTVTDQTDLVTYIDGEIDDALDLVDIELANKQPLDSDLTAIAGLTPSNDDIIQRKAGAWSNRTLAQFFSESSYLDSFKPIWSPLTQAAVATHTGDTNETILSSGGEDLVGKIASGDVLVIMFGAQATSSGNSKAFRIYISDSPDSLVNETLIASATATTALSPTVDITKYMNMTSINTQNVIAGNTTSAATGASMGTTAIDFSTGTKYIIITGQNISAAGETLKIQWVRSQINRQP